MLRFVVFLSFVGLGVAASALVINELRPIESPNVLWIFFAGVFVTFVPAVLGHRQAAFRAGKTSIDLIHTVRTAPWWSTALVIASVALMVVSNAVLSEQSFGFDSPADLVGHPERVRATVTFFTVFYALGLHIALSGLKLEHELLELMRSP